MVHPRHRASALPDRTFVVRPFDLSGDVACPDSDIRSAGSVHDQDIAL